MSENNNWGPAPKKNKGQFPPGTSGNKRGRPRKVERTFTRRQLRHDFLGLMEETFELTIAGKTRRVPIILAVYYKMVQMAIGGDRQMILETVKLRADLIEQHKSFNFREIEALESHERKFTEVNGEGYSDGAMNILNELRKKSRQY